MKCSDIPDAPILEFLVGLRLPATWFNYEGMDLENPNMPKPVWLAMPDGINIPENLVRAKMKGLISRGLVDGCNCGCRGDYEITTKGLKYLNTLKEKTE